MDKETEILKKRLLDLANQSYRNNMFCFSPFLSLSEQQLLEDLKKEMGNIKVTADGGYEFPERVVLRFGDPDELGYEEPFPIVCLHIKPLLKKFADQLTHRDFLGAVMNLSIERNTIGDIVIEGQEAFLFCHDKVASYICEELSKIKHTTVICERTVFSSNAVLKEPVSYEILVASERIDGVVAKIYHFSRSQSVLLFREKRIFVNGKQQENNSYFLKEGDIVTVRGFGKFIYDKQISVTKKEKLRLQILKFE